MPKLYMLIGASGSGKSTWIQNQNFNMNDTVIISSDNIIEARAAAKGMTYSDVFQDEIKSATAEMHSNLKNAISQQKNIVWDQTNLTAKIRKGKLAKIPTTYEKIAVFFTIPEPAELQRRLMSRVGKNIPQSVVENMKNALERPAVEEGFTQIIVIQ